jgi:hypothetical protein
VTRSLLSCAGSGVVLVVGSRGFHGVGMARVALIDSLTRSLRSLRSRIGGGEGPQSEW